MLKPMEKNSKKSALSTIIQDEMDKRGIRISELAYDIGLPQTTVSRIVSGTTDNPTAQTLIALSDYFRLSLDYLLGRSTEGVTETPIYEAPPSSYTKVPLISWEYIKKWVYSKDLFLSSGQTKWVVANKNLSSDAFAINVVSESYRQHFSKGTTLIIDRKDEYFPDEYVLASVRKNKPTIWKVIEDSGSLYLNAIAVNIPSEQIGTDLTIYGKVVESRIVY